MPKIDIGAVLRQKAPRLARWIPRPVVNWLRRTIHESEINHILEHYWSLPPQEFIRACFREWQVTYSIEGLEKLDPRGRYLFASNHPFGGMDGMMLADKLIDRFGDARVVVNDLLMHLEPLRPLWIPVNKHGSQSSLLRPQVRRGVLRRAADPDLPRGPLLALHRRRGDRPRVEDQLPEKSLRHAAADRPGLRRRASCRNSSTASTGYARRWESNSTSRCCGFPTRCSRRRASTSASSSATRSPWPTCNATDRCTNRRKKYAKKRIF